MTEKVCGKMSFYLHVYMVYVSPFLLHFFTYYPHRDSIITSRLRPAALSPASYTRTNRFTSSVQYFLLNY